MRTHRVVLPLRETFVTALRRTDVVETLIVEVETDDGVIGLGEASQVWQVTGESMDGARACIEGPLSAVVIGRDPEDLQAVLRDVRGAVVGNTSAKAAVDVALHDLLARSRGLPLFRMLGGAVAAVETDVTLSVGDPDHLAASASARVSEGFRTLKVKVAADERQALRGIMAVRDAVGPDIAVRLDANQAWTDKQAIRVIGDLEDAGAGVEFVEQPVLARDVSALERVTRAVHTPVMADEAVFGIADLVEIIHRRAVDMINVKLAKCAGIAVATTLLDLARECGLGTIVGSMMESPVGVAASASVAAAHGTTAVSDLDAAWWIRGVSAALGYEAGSVVVSARPGLGIESIEELERVG
ncbi:dipeptide epimerase [Microbacterium soli]|uniref:dipeptide epimerase n=1 Tax=Microbacterium soli TaxID=446075 RepID=UPI0031D9E88E